MPRPNSTYITKPQWDDLKKVHSREETILQTCHDYLGDRIGPDRQYWTLAGSYCSKDHEMAQDNLELNQLIHSGIIEENQYHGVDLNASIIENNKILYPNVNWHHGDFLKVMKNFDDFNPGFINYDGVMQKYFGVKYLRDILRFLDYNVNQKLVLTANFCLNNPYKKAYNIDDGDAIFESLKRIYRIPSHWLVKPSYYCYNGSGQKSKSWMATLVMVKEPHDCENVEFKEEIRFLEE